MSDGVRCQKCGKILAGWLDGRLGIVCRWCKHDQVIEHHPPVVSLAGKSRGNVPDLAATHSYGYRGKTLNPADPFGIVRRDATTEAD